MRSSRTGVLPGLRGATLSRLRPFSNSSRVTLPSPLMSSCWKRLRMSSVSNSSPSVLVGSCTTGTETCWYLGLRDSTDLPSISSATASTNFSVVSPCGPARSRVPRPLTKAVSMPARILPVNCRIGLDEAGPSCFSLSTAAWFMAPISASTMPRGLKLVSLPAKWSFHMSATVPWDASNSLIREPSSFLPMRLDVMKPGDLWIWAISSVSMSPS
mmetsp:Transcript_18299/g.50452  ORF Transcript_18299/g.50452 Transcript_18299/m.50452 type:complete len:214 (-) Transcript_18299:879-1520(-)